MSLPPCMPLDVCTFKLNNQVLQMEAHQEISADVHKYWRSSFRGPGQIKRNSGSWPAEKLGSCRNCSLSRLFATTSEKAFG